MDEIAKLLSEQGILENKKLPQIISFLGTGKLKDGDNSFRKLISNISNDLLIQYAEECLQKGFSDSGFALQDVVNEIGTRLGFDVTAGLYRGNRKDIGFDGIWRQYDNWTLVVEVKTTDAYRISLDAIARYRMRLIEENKLQPRHSSILIIVGRDDTGELEAQIRGSVHAWDIRIISVDSLIRLLRIKESLSDESTAQRISMALRPYEFTRIDNLIDLLFLAVKDVEVEEKAGDFLEQNGNATKAEEGVEKEKVAPVSFHEPVFHKLQQQLGCRFIKRSKSSYSSTNGDVGIIISISKEHPPFNSQFDARYWFAFHPHQESFLSKFEHSYACYGCGDENHVFMIPLSILVPKLAFMWKTKNADRDYTHIVIYRSEGKYYLRTNINNKEHYDDLSSFVVT